LDNKACVNESFDCEKEINAIDGTKTKIKAIIAMNKFNFKYFNIESLLICKNLNIK